MIDERRRLRVLRADGRGRPVLSPRPGPALSRGPRFKPASLDGPATLAALSTARSIIARLLTTSWCSAIHASFAASDKA